MAQLTTPVRAWLTEAVFRGHSERDVLGHLPQRVSKAQARAFIRRLQRTEWADVLAELAVRVARLEWQQRSRRVASRLDRARGRIERVPKATPRQFVERWYAPQRPVVLTGMTRDWRALERWSLPWLQRRFAAAEIAVVENRSQSDWYDLEAEALSRLTTLGEFIGWIRRVRDSNERYMVARNNGLASPALAPLLSDIGFFGGILDRRRIAGLVYLWLGPGGTVTPLHHDTTNILFVQVRGRKRVMLVDPAHAELLRDVYSYYSFVDPERPDVARFPHLEQLEPMAVMLRPGEALFIPAGWWHHVRALTPSISVSMTNFTEFLDTDDTVHPLPGWS